MEMITIPKTEIDQVLKALEIAKAEIGRLNRIIRGNRRQLGGKCMSAINLITEAEALKIIETRRPIGLFMAWEGGKAIGIDNSTGDAWTEVLAQYLLKGASVLVEGRLKPGDGGNPRVYQRKDGSCGASYEVTADNIQFVGNKKSEQLTDEDVPF